MRTIIVSLMSIVVGACGSGPGERTCATNDDCLQDGVGGTCLPSPVSASKWCAFPDATCTSGDRWGTLSGDGLGGKCLESGIADGGSADGASPDGHPADAAVDSGQPIADAAGIDAAPPQSTRIVVAASALDQLWLYDAATLAPDGTVTLPDRSGVGNSKIGVADGRVWISSVADVHAVDLSTLSGVAGFPRTFDSMTECSPLNAFLVGGKVFCTFDPAGTVSDRVKLFNGAPPTFVTEYSGAPSPLRMGGSETRVLVSYGTDDTSIAVLDSTLTPIAGSPVVATTGPVFRLRMSDELGLFAVGGGADLDIFNRSSLVKEQTLSFAADVAGVAFDVGGNRIVVTLVDGRVTARSASAPFAEVVAPVSRATESIFAPMVDETRGRIYALTQTRLIVLDAASLDHLGASPVTLPNTPSDLANY